MDAHPQGKRKRRLGFLVALLLCTTACTLLVLRLKGPFQQELSRHRRARNTAWQIEDLGGRVYWNPKMEILETLWRDRAFSRITDVRFSNPAFPDEKWLILQELPQRFGLHVAGAQFTDASLDYLKRIELLNYLVVENTSVTDQGVAGLLKARPEMTVMYGYPGQPAFRRVYVGATGIRAEAN